MFRDRLKATITLKAGLSSSTIEAGNVKSLELEAMPWGFRGTAEFWIINLSDQSEDELFATFLKRDLMEITLSIARAFDEVEEEAVAMSFKGLVTEKRVLERAFPQVAGEPVLQRRYTVHFADRAQVLWSQHFPNALYVDKTLKNLFDDNLPKGVTLDCPWTGGSTTHPILTLGLGVRGAHEEASFYDFVFWLTHKENVALSYDYSDGSYSLVSKKVTSVLAEDLERALVATVETRFPETRRSAVTVMNAYSEAATRTKTVTNDDGTTGVRRDFLIRSAIANDLTARTTLETARATLPSETTHVTLGAFPAVAFRPAMKVKPDDAWSSATFASGKTYRVASTRIHASAVSQVASDGDGEDTNSYDIDYEIGLELEADAVFRYPPFRTPRWPIEVEGKIVSEVGEATDGTYQPYTDSATSLDFYKVKIPLWADQKVIAPFEPSLLSGHFYFPAYKDARVLVALGFDTASIVSFLDWRPGGRLPIDTQGNHILVGKSATNETSIRHVYEDAKPLLSITRSSSKDLQVIKVSEGVIRFETQETK